MLLFSRSILSDSLQLHGLQHAGLPCPSLSPRVCSDSCPLCWWCHPTISSSVTRLFASGGQNIRASASVLPMSIQGWFPLGVTVLISLLSKGLKNLLQHHSLKASVLWCSAFFKVQLSHPKNNWVSLSSLNRKSLKQQKLFRLNKRKIN